jgi:hypothetical protein
MKKILCLSIATILCCNVAISQKVNIQRGEEFKTKETPLFAYYIGADETGIYIKGYKESHVIRKIDPNTFKDIYTTTFELEPKTGRYMNAEEIHSTQLIGDKIWIFTTRYDVKESIKYFLLREFDSKTGKSLGDKKVIASLASDPFGTNGRNFFISFSPDKSKMAVVSEFKWPKKTSEVSVSIYETATNKKLGTKPLIDGYKNSTISSFNYRVDNNGNFYYLFYYMIDFEEEIGGLALTTIKSEATQSIITPLPFDKLEIKNGTFEFVNDNLIFSGAFVDVVTRKERKEGKEAKAGFYTFFIDRKTGEIKNKGFDYFTAEVNTKLTYSDFKVEESPAKKHYGFEKIITIKDDIYLIESHSYILSGDNGYFDTEREYIITKFNKDCKMQWMKVIPKFTANMNDFNYIVKNNSIYMVYLDHPNNIKDIDINNYKPKKVEKVKNIDESTVVCASVDENGNLSRNQLFLNNELFYEPGTENIILKNNTELLIRLSRGKKERFDKISIN